MEYIERLETALTDLEKNSSKLASIPDLVENIKELVVLYSQNSESLNQSKENLDEIEIQLKDRIDELEKVVKEEQESKDELIYNVKSVLTEKNKEQLDAVDSVKTVVNNKISVAESNIMTKTAEIANSLELLNGSTKVNEEKIQNVNINVLTMQEKMCGYGDKTSENLNDLVKTIPVIKRTQIFAVIAMLLALASCILTVVM